MEFEDYETLPTSRVRDHMIAGAVAGVLEHSVMYPVDSVKTRMQSLAPSPEAAYQTIREGLQRMIRKEGITRPLSGVSAVILGAGPAHALYFSAYEKIKKTLASQNPMQNHLANATAGCGATLLHDSIMVPADVIKQRMQMYNSPYSSCFDCMRKLYRSEGLHAFYRSYTTQLVMNVPFHAIHIMTYEKMQETFNPDRSYNPHVHMAAGAIAGAVAAAVTTPLDMCKTVLNTQEESTLRLLQQPQIQGIWGAFRSIYVMQGFRGFFQGMQARVLYQMPGTAISWSVYELFKYHLARRSKERVGEQCDLLLDGVLPDRMTSDSNKDLTAKRSLLEQTTSTLRLLNLTPTIATNCSAAEDNLLGK